MVRCAAIDDVRRQSRFGQDRARQAHIRDVVSVVIITVLTDGYSSSLREQRGGCGDDVDDE